MIVKTAGDCNDYYCDADGVSAVGNVPGLVIQMDYSLLTRTTSLNVSKVLVLERSGRPMLLLHWL